jgi:large subunit ribosomal protein L9
LGVKGDLVEVSDGYGRNFLLPRGLADEGTPARVREWQERQASKKAREEKNLAKARETKKLLEGKRVTVKVSAGEGGRLFGSVTPQQIAEALATQMGAVVDKRDVRIEAIKQLGVYPVSMRLAPGVEVELTVSVEA